MYKLIKKSTALLATLVFAMALNIVVFAQGSTSISVSKSNLQVGESTTVSVSASTSSTITVKYTASLMTLSDCTASGYKTEGNSVTFTGTSGDLVFTANSEGTASIIVSASNCSGSSTTFTIGSTASSATNETTDTTTEETAVTEETAEETTEEVTDTATASTTSGTAIGTLKDNGNFDIGGVECVVSERYAESEIPAGFSNISIAIGEHTYKELSNGSITLLYLKPASDTSGSGVFYIYDEANGTLSNFEMLGSSSNYVLLSTPDSVLSANMYAATLSVDGKDYSAYSIDGTSFFYVYGTSNNGVTGWFVYDNDYGTLSRVDTSVFLAASSEDDEVSDSDGTDSGYDALENYRLKLEKFRILISVLVVICVILVFVLVNFTVRKKSSRNDVDDEDDDDEEDFNGDDIFANSPKRTAKKMPRSIVFSDKSEEDDEDEETEEEEPEEEEESKNQDSKQTDKKTKSEKSDSDFDMMDLNDL